jgi:lipopolysaccharide transport system ATP-binding protein
MKELSIWASHLGKRYRLGGPRERYRTFRDAFANALSNPLRNLRRRGSGEDLWALKDISFELGRGEVLGIIGRNGAGKSTLLKVLARITEPTEGRARTYGRVGSLLEVGTGFHPELTGRENILLSGAILGMRRHEITRKFDQIVEFAEVTKFVDTPVKHYSSGMYLRLAFAVAAHLEPAILMVDEVLAVGDLAFQRKCLGKMQEVGESGQTVLFVSHDLTAISRLASQTIVLKNGGVAFQGPTREAIGHYVEMRPSAGQLRDRHDRTGDGVVRLDWIRITGADGMPADHVGAGEPVTITIGYRGEFSRLDADDIALDMRFTDMMGHPIATFSTRFSPPRDRGAGGAGVFVCRIPELLLAEETYSIDLWLAYRGGLADCVTRAAELRVVCSNFFETGQEPVKRKHGAALIRHEWRMRSDGLDPALSPDDAAVQVTV